MIELEFASRSDIGKVRSTNQDAFGAYEARDGARLFVVADGMGGHRGGGTASRMAVEAVAEIFLSASHPSAELLRDALVVANERVYREARERSELSGMGTTCVALLFDTEGRAWVGHVGDSRAYRLRGEEFDALSADHSVVAELVRRGDLTEEQGRVDPRRNQLLRAIGTEPWVEPEVNELPLEEGDRLLLCTDGLTGVLPDIEIGGVLYEDSAEEAASNLVAKAIEAGGPDNVTVQVIHLPTSESESGSVAPPQLGRAARSGKGRGRFRRRTLVVALILGEGVFLALLWLAFGQGVVDMFTPPERPLPFEESLLEDDLLPDPLLQEP